MIFRRKERGPVRMGKGIRWAALLLALLLPAGGLAGGKWMTFPEKTDAKELGFLVHEYTGTVTMTFMGDCTLGGEEKTRGWGWGFVKTVETNGMDFPMRDLSALTKNDDLTVANLECVLTDRDLEKVEKQFNFSGSTAYTEILKRGGVDCVTLANNHTHDYGDEGYQDTKDALENTGVAYFGTDCVAVWENEEGLRIGFAGASFSVSGNQGKRLDREIKLLKDLGCAAIVTVMHAGTEYEYEPGGYQYQIARKAAEDGADLVVGHHPHVAQGYGFVQGIPVAFSLGNCIYGGRLHPPDLDALILQADMHFEDGELTGTTLRFYPISITSDERYNNYSPVFLTGAEAERVLKKLEKSTGNGFGPFDEEKGAAVECPAD